MPTMPQEIARLWFVPGEGIDRHVISADIQRYLGNDATVRPGQGNGDQQGVQGYWIKAYRNLTSAMIADLRADSARWRQEQRTTGTREPYVGSTTYHQSGAARAPVSRPDHRGDSPSIEGPYGLPPGSRGDRMPIDRDPMMIDPPVTQPRGYGQERERVYPAESRGYPQESRYGGDNRPAYPADAITSPNGYGASNRPPVSSAYGQQEPRYTAAGYPQPNDGVPSGYARQPYMVPVSGYDSAQPMPRTAEPYGSAYGQQPSGRDPRESRYPQPEYSDPRYAYPSPAATVSSVAPRDRDPREREPVTSPPQPNPYGAMPPSGYDQYGRPVANMPSQVPAGSGSVYGRVTSTTGGGASDRRTRR